MTWPFEQNCLVSCEEERHLHGQWELWTSRTWNNTYEKSCHEFNADARVRRMVQLEMFLSESRRATASETEKERAYMESVIRVYALIPCVSRNHFH